LYNSSYESVDSIGHVSRSLVWIEPDHIVVYDRVETQTDDRFKRIFLQLLGPATVSQRTAVSVTPGGQQLIVTALLPETATMDVSVAGSVSSDDFGEEVANGDPITHRLRVDSGDQGRSTRFLHVLQGADGGVSADEALLVRSDEGGFEGAVVGDHLVMFPTDISEGPGSLSYEAPAEVVRHLITGLESGASYEVGVEPGTGQTITVSITSGGSETADDGGVLDIRP
jgi:hypothetical protein